MSKSSLYYDTNNNSIPDTEETGWIEFNFSDVINQPRILEWIVPDPNNSIQKIGSERYYAGQKVLISEGTTGTGFPFFYGQVEFVENSYDSQYGQTIRITARDMLSAWTKYSLNLNYFTSPPNTRISATIKDAIDNEIPATTPAFDTSSTNWFETSNDLYGVTQNISYIRSKIEALRAFQRLAQMDRYSSVRATKDLLIDAVSFPYEYGYYLFSGNYTGSILRLFYFPRDNYVGNDISEAHKTILAYFDCVKAYDDGGGIPWFTETTEASNVTINDMTLLPAVPADNDAYYFGHTSKFNRIILNVETASNGDYIMNYEYWNGAAWVTLVNYVDNSEKYTVTGNSLIYWDMPSDWVAKEVNTQTEYWARFRISASGAPTQALGTQAWIKDASVSGLTVQFKGTNGDQIKPMFADYTFSKYPSEILTRAATHYAEFPAPNAAEINLPIAPSIESAPPNGIGRAKEDHFYMYELRNSTIATLYTNAMLWQQMQLNGIWRGEFSIPYYPYFKIGATNYLVRAGHTIKVINSNANVNFDMIVTSIDYSEPSTISRIKVMETLKGYGNLRY